MAVYVLGASSWLVSSEGDALIDAAVLESVVAQITIVWDDICDIFENSENDEDAVESLRRYSEQHLDSHRKLAAISIRQPKIFVTVPVSTHTIADMTEGIVWEFIVDKASF